MKPFAAAAVIALLLVAGVFAAVAVSHSSDLSHDRNEQNAVSASASQLAAALLSYNATNLGASRNRVLALSTPAFAATYNTDFSQALSGTITALGASATAQVRDVYVDKVAGSSAHAIVVVDFKTTSKAGTRNVVGTYLQMDVVKQGGTWKVDSVTVLSATSESQATSTTTTTAVPAKH